LCPFLFGQFSPGPGFRYTGFGCDGPVLGRGIQWCQCGTPDLLSLADGCLRIPGNLGGLNVDCTAGGILFAIRATLVGIVGTTPSKAAGRSQMCLLVRTDGTSVEAAVAHVRGSRDNPMTEAQMLAKFADCAEAAGCGGRMEHLLELISTDAPIADLMALLAPEAGG